jgi:hypothetical protein
MRATVVSILLGAGALRAQVPACSLSGQTQDGGLDSAAITFVSYPLPRLEGHTFTVRSIARVAGLRPLVVEVLDDDPEAAEDERACELRRIGAADVRLRDALSQLQFGDLVKTTLMWTRGAGTPMVMIGMEKIEGEPLYFHPYQAPSRCANRTGTVVSYRQSNGETTEVYRDGAIFYRDIHGDVFDRRSLSPDEMASLMRAFESSGFNRAGDTPPEAGARPWPSSIALVCARRQTVTVPGHEIVLAPVLRNLEQVKAKAAAGGDYLLTYQEKREMKFLQWPFRDVSIEAVADLLAKYEVARNADCGDNGQVRGDFHLLKERRTAGFFKQLPNGVVDHRAADPNRDVYFRSGTQIYRIEFLACSPQIEGCKDLYQFESLVISKLSGAETLVVGEYVKDPVGASKDPKTCCGEHLVERPMPKATETGCSGLTGLRLLWPEDAGVALGDVPAAGLELKDREYVRNSGLFRELMAADRCGGGLDYVDGKYWYGRVKMVHRDGALTSR